MEFTLPELQIIYQALDYYAIHQSMPITNRDKVKDLRDKLDIFLMS